MYLITPNNNINEVIETLHIDHDLEQVLNEEELTLLKMPKFKIESSYNLKSYLVNLGTSYLI